MYERSHVAEPPHPTVACCMPGPDLEPSNTDIIVDWIITNKKNIYE